MENTAKDKATARPWANIDGLRINGPSQEFIARTAFKGDATPLLEITGEMKANASLIVKCCNGWDSMIDLLNKIKTEGLTSDNKKRIEAVLEANKN